MPQKSEEKELYVAREGEASRTAESAEPQPTSDGKERPGTSALMERVCERENLKCALQRVRQNKGAAGIDGMTVDELPEYLRRNWPALREELLTGRYKPKPVRRKVIPKEDGGERELGIPTVVDRFIQQAILQVLQEIIDPTFSEHSHGFRPGRSAHGAVREAQGYVSAGREWVVDVDLEQFFDRVNHDVLMSRMAKRLDDKRLLRLLRRYLESGVMTGGIVSERHEGTPQGGPLSPLLANILLDDVDKELEKRGHTFVRYADDCNVYVRSEKAGQRVLAGMRRLYSRLRLRVNEAKSKVARAKERKFLGFTIRRDASGKARVLLASKSLARMKRRIRKMTRPTVGKSMKAVSEEMSRYLRGWNAYFGLAKSARLWMQLDAWIRDRMRALQLRQWRHPWTIYHALIRMGAADRQARKVAQGAGRWWRTASHNSHMCLHNRYFDELGLYRLAS